LGIIALTAPCAVKQAINSNNKGIKIAHSLFIKKPSLLSGKHYIKKLLSNQSYNEQASSSKVQADDRLP
jgi:hypothetical protein